jgi:hypothetical protein
MVFRVERSHDMKVIKQDSGLSPLESELDFPVNYRENGATIKAKHFVVLLDKLKKQH